MKKKLLLILLVSIPIILITLVIVFRMNQIKDVTDIFSIICDKLQE